MATQPRTSNEPNFVPALFINGIITLSTQRGTPHGLRTAAHKLLTELAADDNISDVQNFEMPPFPRLSTRLYELPRVPMISMSFILTLRRLESRAWPESSMHLAVVDLLKHISDHAVVEINFPVQNTLFVTSNNLAARLEAAAPRKPPLIQAASVSEGEGSLDEDATQLSRPPPISQSLQPPPVKRKRSVVHPPTPPRPRNPCSNHKVWVGEGMLSPCRNCGGIA